MKRKLILLISVMLLFCHFSTICAKGELGDRDAFKTYIGKTRTEVRRISPIFDEMTDEQYIVDYIGEDGEMLALSVLFDDYNLVGAVSVLITKGALKIMDLDDDLDSATAFGVISLGFKGDDILERNETDDGKIVMSLKGGITVIGFEMSDRLYAIMGMQR